MSTPHPPREGYPQEPYRPDQPWPSPPHPRTPLPQAPPPAPRLSRDELAATIEARRELGPEYESALVDRLAYEVDRVVEARAAERYKYLMRDRRAARDSLTLAVVSLGAGIPITAIAAGIVDLPGLIVAWGGIVGVNLAHALASRRRR